MLGQCPDPQADRARPIESPRKVCGDNADEARSQTALRSHQAPRCLGQASYVPRCRHVLGEIEVVNAKSVRCARDVTVERVGQAGQDGLERTQQVQQSVLLAEVHLQRGKVHIVGRTRVGAGNVQPRIDEELGREPADLA